MTLETDAKLAYQEKAKEQLDMLNARINELQAKVEQTQANAKIKYQDRLVELYSKRDTAQIRLQELQQSSEEAWIEIQQGFEKAWTELNSAWDNALFKF